MACKEVILAKLDITQQMLNSLSGRLSNESNIQEDILTLVEEWKTIKEQMIIILNQEGNEVYQRKEKLFSKIRPNELLVMKLKFAVNKLGEKLVGWADMVRIAQGSNHEVVSKCISRKCELAIEMQRITLDIDAINREIRALQIEIDECDKRALSCAAKAKQFEYAADKKHSNAADHVDSLITVNALMAFGGMLLAPLTGGASVPLAAVAAAGNTVVQGTAASVNKCSADNDEARAKKERIEADRLRQKISDHNQTLRKNEEDVSRLKRNENDLDDTCAVLKEVESEILSLIEPVEEQLLNIQNIEMLLQQAIDNGDALSIILRANNKKVGFVRKLFRRKPKYLDRTAEDFMLKIHDKLDEIEKQYFA